MSLFLTITPDSEAARAEILETLKSYGARTRAELLNAAQIIACGLSAIDTLAEANATDMIPAMRLRFRACANNLNRVSQQNEIALAKRLRCNLSDAAEPPSKIIPGAHQVQGQDALVPAAKAMETADVDPNVHPVVASDTIPVSREERNKRICESLMMDALFQLGMPIEPPPAQSIASAPNMSLG